MAIQTVLILHGGAGNGFKTKAAARRIRKKIQTILRKSYAVLQESDAVEAVTYAVRLLEDDPDFNAGTGSLLQADGRARLSASLMDGKSMRFSGVVNVEEVKNPALMARRLLHEKDRVLAGREAAAFAKKCGFELGDTRTAASIQRWKKMRPRGYDTVGACALDRDGNLASATSTGGRGMERPGRVSDSAMPIANYADAYCAVSATGIGEEIMDEGLAVTISTRVRDGLSLERAFQKTFREAAARRRQFGAIGLDARGKTAFATTTKSLTWGWQRGKKQKLF
jgi:L-asparaginase